MKNSDFFVLQADANFYRKRKKILFLFSSQDLAARLRDNQRRWRSVSILSGAEGNPIKNILVVIRLHLSLIDITVLIFSLNITCSSLWGNNFFKLI